MSSKALIMLGLTIGSTVGSYIPVFFGASVLSLISILSGAVGGIVGIYIAYKISEGY